jgi:Ca2+-binding EF-hand superfamily protein
VAVDTHKSLKFYEFIDKEVKEAEEKKAKEEEKLNTGLRELLDKYDTDFSGKLNYEESTKLFKELFDTIGMEWVLDDDNLKELFAMFDTDNSG